ncbi:hypothetical protein [Streptomyces lydicus]|uniref:hypothetical protein n=1 Tax=Streptomyces lydicus TaxID=47763 RepID=UPI0036EFABA7
MGNQRDHSNYLQELIAEAKSEKIYVDAFRHIDHPHTPQLDVVAALVFLQHQHFLIYCDHRGWVASTVQECQVSGVAPSSETDVWLGPHDVHPRLVIKSLQRLTH